eukprot:scaffold10010_cov172-Skeletonema_marinoi.AAC.1
MGCALSPSAPGEEGHGDGELPRPGIPVPFPVIPGRGKALEFRQARRDPFSGTACPRMPS